MRFLFAGLALASMVAAASYSLDRSVQPLPYANSVSRAFAFGDNDDPSGWSECVEAESTHQEVGVICEGRRNIAIHNGQLVDVNYFCEFQFKRGVRGTFKVSYGLCQ